MNTCYCIKEHIDTGPESGDWRKGTEERGLERGDCRVGNGEWDWREETGESGLETRDWRVGWEWVVSEWEMFVLSDW